MLNEDQRRQREQTVYKAVLAQIAQGADLGSLTVSQIAAAAGMGKGTLYEYFASKEEIVKGLTAYCVGSELDIIEAALTRCQTLPQAVDAMMDYLGTLASQRGSAYQIIARALAHSRTEPPQGAAVPVVQRLTAILNDLFDRLRAAGQIGPGLDNAYCANAVGAACVTCAIQLMPCDMLRTPADQAPVLERTRRLLHRALA